MGGDICQTNCDSTVDDVTCAGSLVCDNLLSDTSTTCTSAVVCRGDADCDVGAGFTCDPGVAACSDFTFPGTDPVGSPCTTGATCLGGSCTHTAAYPQGYCSAWCRRMADLSDTCPSGSTCSLGRAGNAFGANALGFCYDLCDAASTVSKFGSCRTGYTCKTVFPDTRYGTCLPP
jgi:hypothetical protein